MDLAEWYNSLNQPGWAPSVQTIGRVWTLLYPVIIGVVIFVSVRYFTDRLPLAVAAAFWVNLALNIAFTPIQIATKNNALISIVILAVLFTILWSIVAVWPHYRWVAVAYLPYLTWVGVATALQLSLWWLNR